MAEDTIKDEEYAPITQELREYIERHPTMMHAVGLTDLCDNIDAIHKSLEEQNAKLREKVLNQRKQLAELGAENARLVDVLHEVEEEAVLAFNSLRQDCKTITDSSQHFFEKWWHAECEADRLKAENAKLREFASESFSMAFNFYHGAGTAEDLRELEVEYRELGTEVEG